MSDRKPATVDFDSLLIPKLELDKIIGRDIHEKLAIDNSHIGRGGPARDQGPRRSGIGTGLMKMASAARAIQAGGDDAFKELLARMGTIGSNAPVAKINKVRPERSSIGGRGVTSGAKQRVAPTQTSIGRPDKYDHLTGNSKTVSQRAKDTADGATNKDDSGIVRLTKGVMGPSSARDWLTKQR